MDAAGDTQRMKERLTWAMNKLDQGKDEKAAWMVRQDGVYSPCRY